VFIWNVRHYQENVQKVQEIKSSNVPKMDYLRLNILQEMGVYE